MSKQSRIIEDLRPNRKYIFRVRAINAFGLTSPWSEALVYESPGDLSTPNPPGELVAEFESPDLRVSWRAPGQNTDGSLISDLDSFLVTFADDAGRNITYETGEQNFTLTFAMNSQAFGAPRSKVHVSIRAVDTSGKTSEAVVVTAQNSRPHDPPVAPYLVDAFTLINVSMDKGTMADFKRVSLFHSTDNVNFLPLNTPEGALNYTHAVAQGSVHYYKYKLVDAFEQESAGFSPVASGSTLSITEAIVDTEPPTVPGNFRVLDQGFDRITNAYTVLAWNASSDAESRVSYYELQYRLGASAPFQKLLVAGSETETQLEGLKPGSAYQARIRAVDIYGNDSAFTALLPFTTAADDAAPSTPSGYITIPGIGSIGVRWDPNIELDMDHYLLYGSTTAGFTPNASNLLYMGNGTGFVMTGVDFNDTWYFRLNAVDRFGNVSDPTSEFQASSLVTFVEDEDAPATPVNIQATSNVSTNEQITRARIVMTWDHNTEPDLSGYEVGFREQGDIPWTTQSLPAGTDTHTISNLLPSTTYELRIRAFDRNLNKSDYALAQETTPFDQDPPAIPANTNQITVDRTILFFWDSVNDLDLAGYRVQFALDSGFTDIEHTWTGNSTSVEFKGEADTTYYMRVEAFDRSNNASGYSVPISTTTAPEPEGVDITPPVVPVDLTLTSGEEDGQPYIDVTWTGNTEGDLAGYTIQFNKAGTTNYQYITAPPGSTSTRITGLRPDTEYTATILAYDKTGNYSPSSAAVSTVTEPAPPVEPAYRPDAPTNLVLEEVDDVIEVSFDPIVGDVDTYEVWASYGTDTDFSIISDIDAADVVDTVMLLDQNIVSQGIVYYKIYSVYQGVRSDPLTGNHTITRVVSEAGLNLTVEPMATSFVLKYEVPDDRMLDYMSIKHESRLTATGFSEEAAVEVYRGLADTYIYEIPTNELEHYHQFWLSAITRGA